LNTIPFSFISLFSPPFSPFFFFFFLRGRKRHQTRKKNVDPRYTRLFTQSSLPFSLFPLLLFFFPPSRYQKPRAQKGASKIRSIFSGAIPLSPPLFPSFACRRRYFIALVTRFWLKTCSMRALFLLPLDATAGGKEDGSWFSLPPPPFLPKGPDKMPGFHSDGNPGQARSASLFPPPLLLFVPFEIRGRRINFS